MNYSEQLKQKCDSLALLIKVGFAPKGEEYYKKLWADFAHDPKLKAKRIRALEQLRR